MKKAEKIIIIIFMIVILTSALIHTINIYNLLRFKKCSKNNFQYDYCEYYLDY